MATEMVMEREPSRQALEARIAELEQSVDTLTAQLTDYDRAFLANPIPGFFYDAQTFAILDANVAALNLYGYTPEQLKSRNFDSLFVSDTAKAELAKPFNVFGPAEQTGSRGERIIVRVSIFKAQTSRAADARIAMVQDITAAHIAAEALRNSEERYRELFENAAELIFLQDLNGNVLAVNRAAEIITGYERTELLGHGLARVFPDHAWQLLLDSARGHLGGSPPERFEVEIQRKSGGTRVVELSTRPMYRQGNPVVLQAVARDITEYKIAQQKLVDNAGQLRQRNEELHEALKLAQEATQLKEQFLANTSHELRTPMNGIVGMLDLLRGTLLDSDQREYVDTIGQCSGDLMVIINDLLDMAQIEAGAFTLRDEPFDPEDSVRSVATLLGVRAKSKGLELDWRYDQSIPKLLYGDPVRIRQILMNLIANAIKFTTSGGVNMQVFRLGTNLRCEVRDSGIGVEPELQEKIFRPFFQADGTLRRRFGGTGLGLSICKQLIENMGGRIGVENNDPNPGATFFFEIPLRTAPLS